MNAPASPRERNAPASTLRLIGISCVGNDADVVEAFVRHHATLLDHLVILEHNTVDGTREILDRLVAEGLPVSVEHVADRPFDQVRFTNRLLRDALETHGADWVFPLDCDEFLVAPTRADLDAALVQAGDAHVRVRWINYVMSPADDLTEPHPLRRIRHCYDYPTPGVDENPWVWKIAVNARVLGDYYLDRYEICRGNHFLSLLGQGQPVDAPMLPVNGISLAHFPVRSADQLIIKTATAVLARQGLGLQSGHLPILWRQIAAGKVDLEALASATRVYLDTGRHSAEALRDTPLKLAPLAVATPLAYRGYGLPAIAVILKWIEANMFDEHWLK